jgi:hypothetical protein
MEHSLPRELLVGAAWFARVGCAAGLLGLAGCAGAMSSSYETYRLGELTVQIRPPGDVHRICSQIRPSSPGRIYLGCFIPALQTIIAPPDHHVLLHELKHASEGQFHEEVNSHTPGIGVERYMINETGLKLLERQEAVR